MNSFKLKSKSDINKYITKNHYNKYIKDEFLTEDGDADIFLKLDNKEELFDSRTVGRQVDLNDSIYEYIEAKSSMLDPDTKIHLHILGLDLDEEEQITVKQILKEHYSVELYKNQKEYAKYKKNLFMLIGFGLLSFLIYTLLYFTTKLVFAIEVFCFLFSFALWEAFDYYIYVFSEIKIERSDIIQDLLMDVDFSEK